MRKISTQLRVLFVLTLLLNSMPTRGSEERHRLVYQVESVKRKLLRETGGDGERLSAGDQAFAGEVLRTGWWSSAELVVEEFGSHFALGASTKVRLATERPGLLLEVENGKLRAVFDHLEGESPPERVVSTPSAVLAVRGTDYGVWVDGSGDTTVAVFDGQVDVMDREGKGEPVRVSPGFSCEIQRGKLPRQPVRHTMDPAGWKRGEMPSRPGGSMHSTDSAGQNQGSRMESRGQSGGRRSGKK